MRQRFLATLAVALIFQGIMCRTADAGTGQDAAMATQKIGSSGAGAPTGSADKISFTGSFVYNYPIEVPPGIAGVQPSISLNYNSSSGNGLLGAGWDVSLGAIQRSTKNGAPKYNDADVFTFNVGGAAAELVSSDGGVVNYRRKIEATFERFVREGSGWCVYGKDGSRSYYGTSVATRVGPDSNRTFQWALEKVIDRNGNYLTVSYSPDGGILYPDTVLYTGNDATGKVHRKVTFFTQSRPDPWSSYRGGFRINCGYRLRNIETSVSPSGSASGPWSLVRRYSFQYGSRVYGTRSELASIQVSGIDGSSTVTLPAHQFSYLANLSGSQFFAPNNSYLLPDVITYAQRDNGLRFADLDGDGRPELVRGYSLSGSSTYQTWKNAGTGYVADSRWKLPAVVTVEGSGTWYDAGLRMVDLNGDGRSDVLVGCWNHGSNLRDAWINDGQSFVLNPAWRVPDTFWFTIVDSFNNGEWFRDNGFAVIDVNGDGLPDLVQALYIDNPASVGTRTRRVRLNTGTGWASADSPEWALPVDLTLVSNDGRSSVPNGVEFVDLNGDGLVDIVQRIKETTTGAIASNVWLNTGAGWDSQPAWALPEYVMYRTATRPFDNGVRFADMNGDGLPDMVQSLKTTWPVAGTFKRVFMNTGSGWTAPYTWDIPELFSDIDPIHIASANLGVALVDVNGDGKADVVRSYGTPGSANTRSAALGVTTPEALTRISLPAGGTIDATYSISSVEGTHQIPFPINYLKTLSTNDGRGGSTQEVYSYTGGLFDPIEREFLGFSRVDTLDAAGNKTSVYFDQVTNDAAGRMAGNPLKGRVYREEAGNLVQIYKRTDTEWEAPLIGSARFTRVKSKTATVLDGAAPSSTRIQYSYDDADPARSGNVVRVLNEGDTAISGDEQTQEFEYASPGAGYLASFPKHSRLLGPAGQTLSESQFLYDGLPYGSVTKGNISTVRRWLDKPSPARWIETSSAYDPAGNPTLQIDAKGNRTTTQYDAYGFPVSVTDRVNHTALRQFDLRSGEVLSSTDPNGLTSSFVFDSLGRVIKEISPADSAAMPTTAYLYHDELLGSPGSQFVETQVREHSGTADVLWRKSYFDGLGRSWRTEREDVGDSVIEDVQFDNRGLTAAASVPRMRASGTALWITTTYDPLGRTTRVAQPDGTSVSSSYVGRLVKTVTAKGETIGVESDAYGRVIRRTEPYVTNPALYNYDAAGNLTTLVNAKGQSTIFSYDSFGRKLSITDPNAGTWSYSYDDNGNLSAQTDPRGVRIGFAYDNADRLVRRTLVADPNAATGRSVGTVLASFSYDETSGRPCSIGKLTSISDLSGTQSYYHDLLGRPAREVRSVDTVNYEVQRSFDTQNRIVSLRYPSDGVISYTYNTAGLPDSLTDSGNSVLTRFSSYDAMGRALLIEQAGGKTKSTLTYDPVKGVLARSRTDSLASGSPVAVRDASYEYDANRNITRIVDNTLTTRTQTFGYDALDRLVSAQGDYGTEDYVYDDAGNFLSKSGRGYRYDDALHPGAVTKVTLPGLPVTDASTLIARGFEPGEAVYSSTPVFSSGRYNQAMSFNGTSDLLTFPGSSSLSPANFSVMVWVKPTAYPSSGYATILSKCADVPLTQETESWRLVMNTGGQPIVEMARGTTRFSYWYAGTLPLNQWSYLTFTYDGAKMRFFLNGVKKGERLYTGTVTPNTIPVTAGGSLTSAGGPAAATFLKGLIDEPRFQGRAWDGEEVYDSYFMFDAATAYTYDAAGNCVTKTAGADTWSYRYDADGQLYQVLKNGTATATFTYDAFGNRVKKTVAAGTTIYDGDRYEVRPDGSKIDHVSANGLSLCDVVRQGAAVSTYFYHSDHLGSVNVVTSTSGAVVRQCQYRPFGERYADAGLSPTTRWYTGQEEDTETGLDFYRSRYYDSSLGRFISPDSVVPSALDPQSLNRYAYVRNNPVGMNDPTGHLFWVPVVVGAAVGGYSAGRATNWNFWYTAGGAAIGAMSGGLGAFAGNAIASVAGSLAGGIAGGAAAGASSGYVSAVVFDGDRSEGLENGALWGAISGGLTQGLEMAGVPDLFAATGSGYMSGYWRSGTSGAASGAAYGAAGSLLGASLTMGGLDADGKMPAKESQVRNGRSARGQTAVVTPEVTFEDGGLFWNLIALMSGGVDHSWHGADHRYPAAPEHGGDRYYRNVSSSVKYPGEDFSSPGRYNLLTNNCTTRFGYLSPNQYFAAHQYVGAPGYWRYEK